MFQFEHVQFSCDLRTGSVSAISHQMTSLQYNFNTRKSLSKLVVKVNKDLEVINEHLGMLFWSALYFIQQKVAMVITKFDAHRHLQNLSLVPIILHYWDNSVIVIRLMDKDPLWTHISICLKIQSAYLHLVCSTYVILRPRY